MKRTRTLFVAAICAREAQECALDAHAGNRSRTKRTERVQAVVRKGTC
jgi:hypothetical protein